MATEIDRLLVIIDASTEQLRRELKKAEVAVGRSNKAVARWQASIGRSVQKANRWFNRHSQQVVLGLAATGAATVIATKKIADYSNEYRKLQGRLGVVLDSQEEVNEAWRETLRIANATGVGIDATVTLYSRLARATEDFQISQKTLGDITQTVNQAFIVSGATAKEATNAIIQFTQGLASGVVRGDEYRAIAEQAPRLVQLMAASMKRDVGEMKKLAETGALTTDKWIKALIEAQAQLQREFDKFPMTVERSTQRINNILVNNFGKADLSPLIGALQDLGDVLEDPRAVEGMAQLAASVANLATQMAKVMTHLPGFRDFLLEAAGGAFGHFAMGNAAETRDSLERINAQIAQREKEASRRQASPIVDTIVRNTPLLGDLKHAIDLLDGTTVASLNAGMSLEDLYKEREKATNLLELHNKLEKDAADRKDELAAKQKKLAAESAKQAAIDKVRLPLDIARERATAKMNAALAESEQVFAEVNQRVRDKIEAGKDEVIQLQLSDRQYALYTDAVNFAKISTHEEMQAIFANTNAKFDLIRANEAAAESEEFFKRNQEAAAQAAEEAAEQMQRAFADLRGNLSSFFFEFAQDGLGAFDSLVQGFRAMLVQMAADAAANAILLGVGNIAGSLGAPGISSAARQTAGAGGLFASPLGTAGLNFFKNNSTLFTNPSLAPGFVGPPSPVANQFNWANAGWGLAGGVTGGFLANQFVGPSSGFGSTVGALAGTLIPGVGPFLGPAIGSFAGGAIESLLGGDNNGNNAGRALLDLATGQVTASGIGKSFDPANVQRAEALAQQIAALSQALGGGVGTMEIVTGSRDPFQLDGQKFSNEAAFIAAAVNQIVSGAADMGVAFRHLIQDFEGANEELITFATAMAQLDKQLSTTENPVRQAMEDFEAAQAAAGRSMSQAMGFTLSAISEMVTNFDGSATAAAELSNAMAAQQQQAYALAAAILEVGLAIEQLTQESAQRIRESIMTEEERVAAWTAERDRLVASLDDLFSPEEIQEAAAEATRLNEQIFQALSAEEQKVSAEKFAEFAELTNAKAQEALQVVLDTAQQQQQQLQRELRSIMISASRDFNAAAVEFQRAGLIIANAADRWKNAAAAPEVD